MVTTKYQEAREKARKAREEAALLAKDAFKEAADEVFAKHPILKAFRFRQYTPYFNDGDSCEFGVYCDEPDMLAVGDDAEWEDGYEAGATYTHRPDEPGKYHKKQPHELHQLYDAQREVVAFVATFEDGDMEYMFGNHVQVTVDRDDGITQDKYEHD